MMKRNDHRLWARITDARWRADLGLALVVTASGCLLLACGPEGPQGEAGSAGTEGPMGVEGAPGTTGPRGPQGEPGAAGATGEPGSVGPVGPEGPPGADGPSGVVEAITFEPPTITIRPEIPQWEWVCTFDVTAGGTVTAADGDMVLLNLQATARPDFDRFAMAIAVQDSLGTIERGPSVSFNKTSGATVNELPVALNMLAGPLVAGTHEFGVCLQRLSATGDFSSGLLDIAGTAIHLNGAP